MRYVISLILSVLPLLAAEPGSTVVVIYNTEMPESKDVANYYAQKREVPTEQILGFALPKKEAISRIDYVEKLEKPLLEKLASTKLFVPATNGSGTWRFRYLLLCYGMPTKILPDIEFKEDVPTSLQTELRRTDASVDSQLACIAIKEKVIWTGPHPNRAYAET